MSIQTEIDRIKDNVAGAYTAVQEKGGTLPEEQVSDNLAAAIGSIPAGGTDTSDATAEASDIAKGKTAFLKNGLKTGTAAIVFGNRKNFTSTSYIACGKNYYIAISTSGGVFFTDLEKGIVGETLKKVYISDDENEYVFLSIDKVLQAPSATVSGTIKISASSSYTVYGYYIGRKYD